MTLKTTHSVEEGQLEALLHHSPCYFYSEYLINDLRLGFTRVTNGTLVLNHQKKQAHCLLDMRCEWKETDFCDYHDLLFRVTPGAGVQPGPFLDGDVVIRPHGGVIFLQNREPINKITVYENSILWKDEGVSYDGFTVLYYGDNACIIGTPCDMSRFVLLYLVKANEVPHVLEDTVRSVTADSDVKMVVTERFTIS